MATQGPPSPDGDALRLSTAVALTGLAGFTDAVGYVRLNGLFVSFMSGNSTQAMVLGVLGHPGQAAAAAGLVALFVMGAFSGALLAASAGAWKRPALLTVSAALLLLAAAAHDLRPLGPGGALALEAAAMTLAMGLLNSVLHRAGGASVHPTYVTGTLVALGHALAEGAQGRQAPWASLLLAWLGLVAGAALGALAVVALGPTALLCPAAWAAGLALLLAAEARRGPAVPPRPWRRSPP